MHVRVHMHPTHAPRVCVRLAVLLNYAEHDVLAVLGRVATFVSILFGFPLAMLGLKDSLFSLLAIPNTKGALGSLSTHQLYTLVLLSVVATVAIAVSDIGIVVGVSGALLGAAIVYIFPALIYGSALRQRSAGGRRRQYDLGAHMSKGVDFDADGQVTPVELFIYALVPFGIFLGVLGVAMTLKGV